MNCNGFYMGSPIQGCAITGKSPLAQCNNSIINENSRPNNFNLLVDNTAEKHCLIGSAEDYVLKIPVIIM